jgi:hypothetical protein
MKSLNVMSPDAEMVFGGRSARCATVHRAGCLRDVRAVLEAEAAAREAQAAGRPSQIAARPLETPGAKAPAISLDLMGHSTAGHHLLRLGSTPIDMLNPTVARFFRTLADSGLLARLNVAAVRLIGCETAVSDSGRRTMRMLSRTLGVPVYGTLVPLLESHCDAGGFNPAFRHLLVEASANP